MIISHLTTSNRIDYETMVIADPFTNTALAATVSLESYAIGDCLTDTLTGQLCHSSQGVDTIYINFPLLLLLN